MDIHDDITSIFQVLKPEVRTPTVHKVFLSTDLWAVHRRAGQKEGSEAFFWQKCFKKAFIPMAI